MTYHFQNPSDAIVKHYLKNSKVIAVVGLSDREETTSSRGEKVARLQHADARLTQ